MAEAPKPVAQDHKASDSWAEQQGARIERAIQIIVGGTTTVLAGFLSQIWGSGSIPFRTELAQHLQALGILFTITFSLTALRMGSELYKESNPKRASRAFGFFVAASLGVLTIYSAILERVGQAILQAASLPN